jgi:3-hydroxyacyl-CoA dehydrogenase, NAD binding domain
MDEPRLQAGEPPREPPMGVSRVGIVGAGTMGQGIATACAGAGFEVLLVDQADIAARAVEEIAEELDRNIAKWRHTPSEKKAILGRLRPVDGLQPLERADLVIEAVPDELALKGRVFAELDRACSPATVLATALLEAEAANPRARLAIDVFCYRLRKYVALHRRPRRPRRARLRRRHRGERARHPRAGPRRARGRPGGPRGRVRERGRPRVRGRDLRRGGDRARLRRAHERGAAHRARYLRDCVWRLAVCSSKACQGQQQAGRVPRGRRGARAPGRGPASRPGPLPAGSGSGPRPRPCSAPRRIE